MREQKPRHVELRVDFGKDQILSGMEALPGGTLKFFDENGNPVAPVTIETGTGYARDHKPSKTITRGPADPIAIQTFPNQALLDYSKVIAVDTGTDDINGARVSVCCSAVVHNIAVGPVKWDAKVSPLTSFEFHDATFPPERIGWAVLLSGIRQVLGDDQGSIAVIVDSELDLHVGWNERREPILPGFWLPDGLTLHYASGERGTTEFIANAALADCDRRARLMCARLRRNEISEPYLPGPPNGAYSRCRFIDR